MQCIIGIEASFFIFGWAWLLFGAIISGAICLLLHVVWYRYSRENRRMESLAHENDRLKMEAKTQRIMLRKVLRMLSRVGQELRRRRDIPRSPPSPLPLPPPPPPPLDPLPPSISPSALASASLVYADSGGANALVDYMMICYKDIVVLFISRLIESNRPC